MIKRAFKRILQTQARLRLRGSTVIIRNLPRRKVTSADIESGETTNTSRAGNLQLGLLYYGAFKFTAVEAKAIEPLVANSPLMFWLYSIMSVQAVSNLIGVTEIIVALLLCLRPFAPRLSAIGSLGAIAMTLTTLSFLFSTLWAWTSVPGFPLPVATEVGGFLIKGVSS